MKPNTPTIIFAALCCAAAYSVIDLCFDARRLSRHAADAHVANGRAYEALAERVKALELKSASVIRTNITATVEIRKP